MTSPLTGAPVTQFSIDPSDPNYINSLLPEDPDFADYRWGGTLNSNTPLEITYSFPSAGATWSQDPDLGYGPTGSSYGEPWHGFQAFNGAQQQAFRDALATWSDVANLKF